MAKHPVVPKHVDLELGVLHGVLKQVRWSGHWNGASDPSELPLVSCWCCTITTSLAQLYTKFVREQIAPLENGSLLHIKRIRKDSAGENASPGLQILLCLTEVCESAREVELLLLENNVPLPLLIYMTTVPKCAPLTREQSLEWSQTYWPVAWKGNPNHQFLQTVQIDADREQSLVDRLLKIYCESNENGENVCEQSLNLRWGSGEEAVGADRERYMNESLDSSKEIVHASCEQSSLSRLSCSSKQAPNASRMAVLMVDVGTAGRPDVEVTVDGQDNPYEHAIMKAIDIVSQNERKARTGFGNYLCQDIAVYATHEPCVMCSMALVHSRISRIVYLQKSPAGGMESNFQLGNMDGLNWKYEIWRWIGKTIEIPVNEKDY